MDINLSAYDLKKAYRKWHEAAGIFRCFVRASNFVSLKHYSDFALEQSSGENAGFVRKVSDAVSKYHTEDTIVFIELPDVVAIEAAIESYKRNNIAPIITFNGLLHPEGIVGSKAYISSLLKSSEELNGAQTQGYAFILDSNRFGDFGSEVLRRQFNNQYELSEEDLPSWEALTDLGYKNVLHLGTGDMKEDMEAYFEYLKENGAQIRKVSMGG